MHFVSADHPPYFPDNLTPDEHGLVAVGGVIRPDVLLEAYSKGIFPWYDRPVPAWFSPDPRMVLRPGGVYVSRRLQRTIDSGRYRITYDTCFQDVMKLCAQTKRKGQSGTWISPEMIAAYSALHEMGVAHSVECFRDSNLVGGLYGQAVGKVFFGESMVSLEPDASKCALVHLCRRLEDEEFALIDCQVYTPHLESMGASEILREEFLEEINTALSFTKQFLKWT